MGLFTKKRKNNEQTGSAVAEERLINVSNEFGKKFQITLDDWKEKILGPNIQKNWDNPDALYSFICTALNDGLEGEVLDAARRLHLIDPNIERSVCLLGIVLMKNQLLDEAELLLQKYEVDNSPSGVVTTNLAKVYAAQGRTDLSNQTLWKALTLDPNQDNGLLWWIALARENGGDAAANRALETVAALPGSWRALLWLARNNLEANNLDAATVRYKKLIEQLGDVPSDAFYMMSGDLGRAGYIKEIVELLGNQFDPTNHDERCANNILKALLDTGHIDLARSYLDKIYQREIHAWFPTLNYWDDSIDQALIARDYPKSEEGVSNFFWRKIDKPIWSYLEGGVDTAIDNEKLSKLLCLSFSCQTNNDQRIGKTNWNGALSRNIPAIISCCLSNYFEIDSTYQTIVSKSGALVISGAENTEEWLSSTAASSQYDFILDGHIEASGQEAWRFFIRLFSVKRKGIVKRWDGEIIPSSSDQIRSQPLDEIVQEVSSYLNAGKMQPGNISYPKPAGDYMASLIDAHEVALMLMLNARDGLPATIYGMYALLSRSLRACSDLKHSDAGVLLFMMALDQSKRAGSSAYKVYVSKLELLIQKSNLSSNVRRVAEKRLQEFQDDRG